MLCPTCSDLANKAFDTLDNGKEPETPALVHGCLKDFRDAARSGCRPCNYFWHNLIGPDFMDQVDVSDNPQQPLGEIWCNISRLGGTQLLNLRFERKSSITDEELRQRLPFPFVRKFPRYNLIRGPKPYENCRSPDDCYPVLVSQLQSWLRADGLQSTISISSDQPSKRETMHPSRLIRIMQDTDHMQLIDTTSLNGTERYAVLSYRWMQDDPWKCSSKTLPALRQGIPLSNLRKPFQESIKLVKDLGFSFIWIDSICIIQDDREDWARESRTMARVYSNADVTLAVNNSEHDPSASFLEPVFRCFLSRTMASGHPFTDTTDTGPDDLIHLGSLGQRGWALQERLLSKRVVHFVSTEVIFEGHPNGPYTRALPTGMIPVGEGTRGLLPARDLLVDTDSTINPEYPDVEFRGSSIGHKANILEKWFDTVSNFRMRNLTYESDRLIAIDAIATALAKKTGGTYVYGLWKEALARCLLWYASNGYYGRSEIPSGSDAYASPAGTQLPSWSWAACNNRISYNSASMPGHKMKFIVTAETSDANDLIQIYGQLCDVIGFTVRKDEREGDRLHLEVADASCITTIVPELLSQSKGSKDVLPKPSYDYIFNRDSNLFDATDKKLFFLPISAGLRCNNEQPRKFGVETSWDRLVLTGLVLQKHAITANRYHRVGLATYAEDTKVLDVGPLFELSQATARRELKNGVSFSLV